jgi:hypothetical protein
MRGCFPHITSLNGQSDISSYDKNSLSLTLNANKAKIAPSINRDSGIAYRKGNNCSVS